MFMHHCNSRAFTRTLSVPRMNPQTSDSQAVNSVGELSHAKTEYSDNLTTNQRTFLAAFSRTGTISHAATAAGIDRRNHNIWLTDPVYRRAFLQAKEEANDYLESEARRRAVEGVDEADGYWYDKESNSFKPKGFVRRYSDTLLIFLMKGAMPDKYRERIENTNLFKVDPKSLSPEQLDVLAEHLLKQSIGTDDPATLAAAHKQLEAACDPNATVVETTAEVVEDKGDTQA